MNQLQLFFDSTRRGELLETRFAYGLGNGELHSVRGKTPGAFINSNTFQWTSAVQAMALLFVRYELERLSGNQAPMAVIQGELGSAALSLDYALSKQPVWLLEMFGVDSAGRSLLRRVIRRTNPEHKRPGPVVLSVNMGFLEPCAIRVNISGDWETQITRLSMLVSRLEATCGVNMQRPQDSSQELVKIPA